MELAAIVISVLALAFSGLTAWLTLIRKGTVRMTLPTVVYFGPDGGDSGRPKVFFRALLYSSSKRTQIIESMYVRLKRGETSQNFNVWVQGNQVLQRGSGVYVPEHGYAANHHFLLPEDGTEFRYLSGSYSLSVYVRLVGGGEPLQVFSTELSITSEQQKELTKPRNGIYYDWGADTGRYHPHVRETETLNALSKLIESMG